MNPFVNQIRNSANRNQTVAFNHRYRMQEDVRFIDVSVGNQVENTHYVFMAVNRFRVNADRQIAHVARGLHDSASAITAQPDVSSRLFGSTLATGTGGLLINFRERNHEFTLLDTNGDIQKFVLNFVASFNDSRHHAIDSFFHVTGAVGLDNVYVMPFQHDSYYALGFQTVFFIPDSG